MVIEIVVNEDEECGVDPFAPARERPRPRAVERSRRKPRTIAEGFAAAAAERAYRDGLTDVVASRMRGESEQAT